MSHLRQAVGKQPKLTIPDLVVLRFLADRPWHGYDLNLELERCEVQDWAGISRAQVYYSLHKLHEGGLIDASVETVPSGGPERQIYVLNDRGRAALMAALAKTNWSTQRPPTPFQTWLALASFADPAAIDTVIETRRSFLQKEIAKEQATLVAIRDEGPHSVAEQMVAFCIAQFELELSWLDRFAASLART